MEIFPQEISFQIKSFDQIVSSFRNVIDKIHLFQKNTFITGQFFQDLLTAYTEGVANAINHAQELQFYQEVKSIFKLTPDHLVIEIIDHGLGFNLDEIAPPDFKSYAESGRGIFMMRQLMDEVSYQKDSSGNILRLTRNFIGTDQSSKDLDLLYEISSAIIETTDIESVYSIILDKAINAFGVDRASILIFDENVGRLKVVASRGLNVDHKEKIQMRPGEGISGYVFQHAKPCLIEDMRANQSGWDENKNYKSRSFISAPMICSPMRLGQKSLGVINMTDRRDGKPFTKKDLKLLTTISNQAAAYLHICDLLNRAKIAEGLKRELNIAENIQKSYLPQTYPKFSNLEIASFLETAWKVGGDFYDFITKENKLYLVMADVSGHNIGAALTAANFRSQLRAILYSENDPATILNLLNQSMFDDLISHDQFITMLLIRFEKNNNEFVFANAGHLSPLKLAGNQVEEISQLQKSGMVIGSLKEEVYQNQIASLEKNQSLILYTDGITDLTNQQGIRFSLDQLKKTLISNADLPAEQMIQKTKSKLKNYAGSTRINDDMTMVVVKK